MTVKTLEDREFLRSVFLATGDEAVLQLLERGSRGGLRSSISALTARIASAAPVAICIAAMFLYR